MGVAISDGRRAADSRAYSSRWVDAYRPGADG